MLITEYFRTIESQIGECVHLVKSSIVKDQRSLHIGIIEGTLSFSDDSRLHFVEFVNVKGGMEVYKYSYHYQDHDESLIFRYDMAPHHRDISTFPHHKHTREKKVIDSAKPALAEILIEIEESIS